VLTNDRKAKANVAGITGPATLTFRVTVTDADGQTDSDEVTVEVAAPK
jgi:hypothetical protein